jgi:hypothetical protein
LPSERNKKIERQPLDLERIFANNISDKGIISKEEHNSIIRKQIKMVIEPRQTYFKISHIGNEVIIHTVKHACIQIYPECQ